VATGSEIKSELNDGIATKEPQPTPDNAGRQSMTLNTPKIIADTWGVRVRDLVGKL
jgi:hypothetical protein